MVVSDGDTEWDSSGNEELGATKRGVLWNEVRMALTDGKNWVTAVRK